MIVYDWRVLTVERMRTPSVRVRLSDYERVIISILIFSISMGQIGLLFIF